MGGAIFNFLQKIGLKSTKNVRFCTLRKPIGGARAPPPPHWLRYWYQYKPVCTGNTCCVLARVLQKKAKKALFCGKQ